MAKAHKGRRVTSFVTLRTKCIANGRQSFYLDIYKDGKRSYEFLKLYLVPETDKETMMQNKHAEQAARAIRSRRELDIILGKGGISKNDDGGKTRLLDWLETYRKEAEKTGQSRSVALNVKKMAKHIEVYKGKDTKLADIDEDWCVGFIDYLAKAPARKGTMRKKPLAHSTASLYFSIFAAALKMATRRKLIPTNPAINLEPRARKPIRAEMSSRPYLTIDEVKAMIATECRYEQVKRAFLFACFTGLRISDILNLKWKNVTVRNGNYYVSIVMQKTRRALPEMKLNKQALKWMPEQRGTGHVFALPNNGRNINLYIKRWAKDAGIEKEICFHVSRHTFATMELTLGADLYVVSKLLGHSNIGTTQVYADIVNKRRDEAMELLDNAF